MNNGIVSTIAFKCKICYSCIRECPAKAIRVLKGQAVIETDRCISCGHCVKVCSQNAKQIQSNIDEILYELIPKNNVIAIVAPSIAAAFPELSSKIPTALRKIGFNKVCETAFGADLINPVYEKLFEESKGKTIISSPCPAVYSYIQKYFGELTENLAPIVSPMIAMGKYLKLNSEKEIQVVFIGPCAAKKMEFQDEEVRGAIDAVITFVELKEIFERLKINFDKLEESELDPPFAYEGKSYPLAGGLLKTAAISSDVLNKNVIIVEGKNKVEEIINEILNKKINAKFIDILFCEGCISGPAVGSELNYYSKREKVINYINDKIHLVDKNVWKSNIYNSRDIDLSRKFPIKNQRKKMPSEIQIREILNRTNKLTKQDELNCGACGYFTCREYAIAIAKNIAEEEMCLPFLIEKLQLALEELKETQEQLDNAEKLASIGQLAAGVAHEINNPLGTIMLYSSMLKKESQKSGRNNLADFDMIIEEANRCKNIVSNLLNFARQGRLKISRVNIIDLISNIVRSCSINPSFNEVKIEIFDELVDEKIEADYDQLKQVFLNLINNAREACEESVQKNITIKIHSNEKNIIVDVTDTGCGIPEENMKKIFTPFFTTKKFGKGTGLGLAIIYGIIKMHKGDIKIESKINMGTMITITLPKNINQNTIMSIKENEYVS